jgi:hypothetical protein
MNVEGKGILPTSDHQLEVIPRRLGKIKGRNLHPLLCLTELPWSHEISPLVMMPRSHFES